MPRIDPLQLLKCLAVLLTPEGGILSRDEVPRLVSLMTKFSKKLVSKCVYVLILSNTETSLLELFMAEGGWTLIQTWLEDAMKTLNDDLVVEILNLLLMTPVDIERLKSNTIPRLVKTLTKREGNGSVKELSSLLVQKWLQIVKSTTQEMTAQKAQAADAQAQGNQNDLSEGSSELGEQGAIGEKPMGDELNIQENDNQDAISSATFYKITVREGKQVISKLSSTENDAVIDDSPDGESVHTVTSDSPDGPEEKLSEEKRREKTDKKSRVGSSSSKSTSSSKSGSHRDKDKHKSSSSSKSSSSKEKEKSSSSSSRDKNRKDKDKDKYRHNGLTKSTSNKDKERRDSKDKKEHRKDKDAKDKSSDRDPKEKQAEKDKDTLAKIKPQTLDKLGRIPKKVSNDKPKDIDKSKDGDKTKESDRPKENDKPRDDKNKEQKKKGTMSIEVRKNTEERPKTVKIFNSKMRSTGLEEEVKPPPPRNSVKKPQAATVLPSIPQKRPSPLRETPIVPEKKIKLDLADRPIPERPGAIKLIPPKPKPVILQESDIFMDALTASASAKKEPKKRKRRLSLSKEPATTTNSSPSSSPTKEESPGASSPTSLKTIAPPNFYQDTLDTDDVGDDAKTANLDESETAEMKTAAKDEDGSSTPTDASQLETPAEPEPSQEPRDPNQLRSCLRLHSNNQGPKTSTGAKRTVRWKPDDKLTEIRLFDLDETERVNVTKTFMDMAKMEMTSEREALQMSRKLPSEDMMEAQVPWRFPYLVDQPEMKVQPGSNSSEKDIQFAREKNVLQALYFHKRMIPDSPAEPMPENHQMKDPVIIPLDDPECQEMDLRNTPWPEPKGSPPREPPVMVPPMFRNVQQAQQHPQQQLHPQQQPPQQQQPQQPMFHGFGPAGFQGMGRFPAGPQMMDGSQMMDPSAFMGGPQQGPFPHPAAMMNPNMMGGHQQMAPHQVMGGGPTPDMMGGQPTMDPSAMFGGGSMNGPPMNGPQAGGPMNGPPDAFMMNDPNFPMGFNQPNMGMYHPQNDGPGGPGGGGGFEIKRGHDRDGERDGRRAGERGGGRGGRGGYRRGGGGGWVRLNDSNHRGGGGHHGGWRGGSRGRVCKNVKNHGYCRNVDTCRFIHPN